jgi:hypothetical protein
MNRHERRAAEAQARAGASADKGFAEYRDLYRKAFLTSSVSDREIGEGWMRGEKVKAENYEYMTLHAVDQSPPPPADDDFFVSVGYNKQIFAARGAAKDRDLLVKMWISFIDQLRQQNSKLLTGDDRADARSFIFEMVLGNQAWDDGTKAALTAGAIAWLVKTSPAGATFGDPHFAHKIAHYQISDQTELTADGRRARNFRLSLMNDYSELDAQKTVPLPRW